MCVNEWEIFIQMFARENVSLSEWVSGREGEREREFNLNIYIYMYIYVI